jgi:flagellar basal body rod protein FlgG
MRKLLLSILLCAGAAYAGPRDEPQVTLRKQMLAELGRNEALLDTCFEDMRNQFTPGYRAHEFFQPGRLRQSQGEIFMTHNPLNLAVEGDGFFVVGKGGKEVYTRDGRFSIHAGLLEDENGGQVQAYPLDPQGNITGDQTSIAIALDPRTKLYRGIYDSLVFDRLGRLMGEVQSLDPVTGQLIYRTTLLYQVTLVSFESATALHESATGRYEATSESGPPLPGVAGQGTLGSIHPGSLELANVHFHEEANAIRLLQTYSNLLLDGSYKTRQRYENLPPIVRTQPWFVSAGLPTVK